MPLSYKTISSKDLEKSFILPNGPSFGSHCLVDLKVRNFKAKTMQRFRQVYESDSINKARYTLLSVARTARTSSLGYVTQQE